MILVFESIPIMFMPAVLSGLVRSLLARKQKRKQEPILSGDYSMQGRLM